jgi:hypothetical protein
MTQTEDAASENNFFPRRMSYSGMLRRVALVRADVSEERIATIIRVTRIGELGTMLRVSVASYKQCASVASYC